LVTRSLPVHGRILGRTRSAAIPETKDLADALFYTPTDIEGAACFDHSDHLQNFGCVDFDNGVLPEDRKDVALQRLCGSIEGFHGRAPGTNSVRITHPTM
jgi:hypothetical protein